MSKLKFPNRFNQQFHAEVWGKKFDALPLPANVERATIIKTMIAFFMVCILGVDTSPTLRGTNILSMMMMSSNQTQNIQNQSKLFFENW